MLNAASYMLCSQSGIRQGIKMIPVLALNSEDCPERKRVIVVGRPGKEMKQERQEGICCASSSSTTFGVFQARK